jgi:sodium transport system permease protein
MSENASQVIEPPMPSATGQQALFGRLRRLVLKELRETLRDRRTIITLAVMPLVIYPLLAAVFQRFLVTSITVDRDAIYVVGVESDATGRLLARQLRDGSAKLADRDKNAKASPPGEAIKNALTPAVDLRILPSDDSRRYVADSSVHLAVLQRREPRDDLSKGLRVPVIWELQYRTGSPTSEAALHYVESHLQAYNEIGLNEQLQKLGVAAALPAATERHPIEFMGAPVFSLAALIPLILVLMTVTGAVYPAIDLTAGERERGTLETLIAAPVPRLGLLLAKYVAVLTVAILTAVVNLVGMTITAHSSGLAASLFGGGGLTFIVAIKVFLLLVLFAAFFSAILLALTSYARSFKEAQAYIIPLMLVCLVPGVLCLLPSLEFKAWMAVTPLVNIVVLARDLLEGSVQTSLAIAAICSTILYIAAAIALAARIFGTDAILYGSQATWSDFVRRPAKPQSVATVSAAMLCLALMFPCYFVLANGMARSQDLSMDTRLIVGALITAAVFGGIPIATAWFGSVRWSTGLGLRTPNTVELLAAAILGLALWPGAHEITLLAERLGLLTLSSEKISLVEDLVKRFQAVPLWLILLTLALAPAVFEELCFRGFLFGALRTRLTGGWTVIATAILFGVFHEILFPGKLLPSTFLGLVLGWVRLRTGSVLPGILLHALHNATVFSILYYRDELLAHGWGVEEEQHLPMSWHAAAAMCIVVAIVLLRTTTNRRSIHEPSDGITQY